MVALCERPSPDVFDGGSLQGVDLQHEHQEVGHRAVQVLWDVEDSATDLLKEGGNVFIVEGQRPAQEGVEDDPAAPDVHLGTSIQPARDTADMSAQAACTMLLEQNRPYFEQCGQQYVISLRHGFQLS